MPRQLAESVDLILSRSSDHEGSRQHEVERIGSTPISGGRIHSRLKFGPFELSAGERVLRRDGVVVPLGSRALDILTYLAERPGTVIGKKEFIDHVWSGVTVEESGLRVHISAIRKALDEGHFGNRYIANVQGRGYSFVGAVVPFEDGGFIVGANGKSLGVALSSSDASEKLSDLVRSRIRGAAMPEADSTVVVIDDDPDLRASVGRLLRSVGMNFQLFESVSHFINSDQPSGPTCLVLDIRLPGQSGLDLQRELSRAKREIPIIFITGHGDIPMSVEAMKGGAIEFLTKPFRDQDLLDAIQLGLSRDRIRLENEEGLADLKERFVSLSPREREIVIQVARGRLSKQIAHEIGIAEATVKVHRSRAMQKMKAGSLPELGRMADKLQLVSDEPQRS